jgi:hypothetical protein
MLGKKSTNSDNIKCRKPGYLSGATEFPHYDQPLQFWMRAKVGQWG